MPRNDLQLQIAAQIVAAQAASISEAGAPKAVKRAFDLADLVIAEAQKRDDDAEKAAAEAAAAGGGAPIGP